MTTPPQDVFIASIEESRQLLSELQQHLDAFMDRDPDTLHWGDVGDANRLKADLQRALGLEN